MIRFPSALAANLSPTEPATVSAEPTPVATEPTASRPIFGRAALAILGSMVLLILALTGVLIETTWYAPEGSAQPSAAPAEPAQVLDR